MNTSLTPDELAARDNLVRIMGEVALQCDDTYSAMKLRLTYFHTAIGYRVMRGDALDDVELKIIIEEGRAHEEEMKAYKQTKLQTV